MSCSDLTYDIFQTLLLMICGKYSDSPYKAFTFSVLFSYCISCTS